MEGPDYTNQSERKSYLTVKIPLRRRFRTVNTVLDVKPPTKTVAELMAKTASMVDSMAAGEAPEADIDDAYEAMAAALSNNRQGIKVTPADLIAANIDVWDIGDFTGWFMLFLESLISLKK